MLDGNQVDLSELNNELGEIPVGTYSGLQMHFNSTAKIKGTLTGTFDTDEAIGSQEETLRAEQK